LAPRASGESVRLRRPGDVVARPLNFNVRRMTTATHRALELLIGLALVAYGAYAIYTGNNRGAFRWYSRSTDPLAYWTGVLIEVGIGVVCIFGSVTGRN